MDPGDLWGSITVKRGDLHAPFSSRISIPNSRLSPWFRINGSLSTFSGQSRFPLRKVPLLDLRSRIKTCYARVDKDIHADEMFLVISISSLLCCGLFVDLVLHTQNLVSAIFLCIILTKSTESKKFKGT